MWRLTSAWEKKVSCSQGRKEGDARSCEKCYSLLGQQPPPSAPQPGGWPAQPLKRSGHSPQSRRFSSSSRPAHLPILGPTHGPAHFQDYKSHQPRVMPEGGVTAVANGEESRAQARERVCPIAGLLGL